MKESDFQSTVLEAAKVFGWKSAHFRPGMNRRGRWMTAVSGDGVGFPDLVLLHPSRGKMIVAELKSEKGAPTHQQEEWLVGFRMCKIPAYVWRPADWPTIEQVLSGHVS